MKAFYEIPGFPGYVINNDGVCIRERFTIEVKTSKRNYFVTYPEKIVKWCLDSDGYLVGYTRLPGRKQLKQHRALATVFIPNPLFKQQVNHKNGIKNDNSLANLEWVTPQENTVHAVTTGLRNAVSGDLHYKRRKHS